MSGTPTLRDVFVSAARRLRADFHEVSVEPHPAQRGAEREAILTRFLADRLPRRFAVAKGHAIDFRDEVSPQLDVMIYDALDAAEAGGTFIPYDSLIATIEVKSKLTRSSLRETFQATAKRKRLAGAFRPIGQPPQIVCLTPPAFLFAFESEMSAAALADAYIEDFYSESPAPGLHLDFIFVLDQCSLHLTHVSPDPDRSKPRDCSLILGRPDPKGQTLALFASPEGDKVFGSAPFNNLPAPALITVSAWETQDLTLWAFFCLLVSTLQAGQLAPGVPWARGTPINQHYRILAACIDSNTPDEQVQSAVNKVFDACTEHLGQSGGVEPSNREGEGESDSHSNAAG